MRRRLQRGGVGEVPGGGSSKSLRPSLNLLAAALAGAINQLFTLPLENITTRMQTAQPSPPPSLTGDDSGSTPALRRSPPGDDEGSSPALIRRPVAPREDAVGREHGAAAAVAGGVAKTEDIVVRKEEIGRDRPNGNAPPVSAAACCPPGSEPQHHRHPNMRAVSGSACCLPGRELQQRQQRRNQSDRHRRRQRQSLLTVAGELYREGNGIARFWRGFVPSLVLTCNPAINYTAFDLLKALWLRRIAAAEAGAASAATAAAAGDGVGGSARKMPSAGGAAAGSEGFLNPVEAFLVAAAAKSVATLITYPLIRAKVVLMTSSSAGKPSPPSFCSAAAAPFSPTSCSGSCSSSRPSYLPPPAEERDSAVASREKGVTARGGDGNYQPGDGDESTTEDSTAKENSTEVVGGGAVGITQQERERQEVSREDGYARLARAGSWGCGNDDVAAAAAAVAAAAGWEGARGGGEDGDARGMGTVILDIFRREGIGGLYTGCGAQVCRHKRRGTYRMLLLSRLSTHVEAHWLKVPRHFLRLHRFYLCST